MDQEPIRSVAEAEEESSLQQSHLDLPHPEITDEAVSLADVSVRFGKFEAVRKVTLPLAARRVTALVGPSGCGKTTILRAINRMHDRSGGVVRGSIRLGELDIYGPSTQPELVRSKIGMVFQRPNPFPTMSIVDNVTSGLRFNGVRDKKLLKDSAESALRHAALWDTVKDRLNEPAIKLSGGQQQRLCIAPRACGRARGTPDGRTVLGTRPALDGPDRGAHRQAVR